MTDTQTDMVERAATALVDVIFNDLCDRRFLKWLFEPDPDDDVLVTNKPRHALDLDVQKGIKEKWIDLAKATITYATIKAAMQAPPGYKLVPLDPTEEMDIAGWNALYRHVQDPPNEGAGKIYKAMLDAAPEPQEEDS